MSESLHEFLSLDVPALLTAVFAAMACALLGNFLVLRRLSLMGDAISHSVLPGIVMAFLVSGSRASVAVFIGAALAGILTALLVELVRHFGHLESGAAMGVVFSILFASGVLLMEQAAARNIDLDAECLLHGQLETIFWYPPQTWSELFQLGTLKLLPSEIYTSASVFLLSLLFVFLFFKELAFSAFDAALATTLGFNAKFLHYILMIFVAGAVVASFEAVGSILVIAMIICPAATARLFTDRLRVQIFLSLFFSLFTVVGGYLLAAFGPIWLGYAHSVNAAGMMTIVSGVLLFGSAVFAPRYGILSRRLRQVGLTLRVYREDLLAALYRAEELHGSPIGLEAEKAISTGGSRMLPRVALRQLCRNSLVRVEQNLLHLSEEGRKEALSLVRTHRLWESFLVEEAGLKPDHVHQRAEELEHFTRKDLSKRLEDKLENPDTDPHGRNIPRASGS